MDLWGRSIVDRNAEDTAGEVNALRKRVPPRVRRMLAQPMK